MVDLGGHAQLYASPAGLQIDNDQYRRARRYWSTYRRLCAPRDWHRFRRDGLLSILRGFVADDEIPPIELLILPVLHDLSGEPFKFRGVNGYQRFYASIAAGFAFVPATMRGVWT